MCLNWLDKKLAGHEMPYTFVVVKAKAIGDNKLRHSSLPLFYPLQTSACAFSSRRANNVELMQEFRQSMPKTVLNSVHLLFSGCGPKLQ